MKIVFMGTPVFGTLVLESLIKEYDVVGVVTQPDKMVGRKKELTFSPIKKLAIKHGIKVFQPPKIKEEYSAILEINPDMIITCAYGQIIPKSILDFPKFGCINVHASLLPKLRGGAPIHRAIINGYDKTGITIMYMDEQMDSGDIIETSEIPIMLYDNVGTIHDKLMVLGASLLIKTIPSIVEGTNKRIKQDINEVTFAKIIKKVDEKIDFGKTKIEVFNQIRGLNPFPGAYSVLDGEIIKIYSSVMIDRDEMSLCGSIVDITDEEIIVKVMDGLIGITEIQVSGKKKMTVKDYLNGLKDKKKLINKVFE